MSVPDHLINPDDDRPCYWCWRLEHYDAESDDITEEPDEGYGKTCLEHRDLDVEEDRDDDR